MLMLHWEKEKMTEDDYDDISPPLSMYFQNVLHSIAGHREFVDRAYPCDDCISFTLHGIPNIGLNSEDPSLNHALQIMGHALKSIYETYGDKYYFKEPFLTYCSTYSHITLSVGISEKPIDRSYEVRG